jgi:hypothetical protein
MKDELEVLKAFEEESGREQHAISNDELYLESISGKTQEHLNLKQGSSTSDDSTKFGDFIEAELALIMSFEAEYAQAQDAIVNDEELKSSENSPQDLNTKQGFGFATVWRNPWSEEKSPAPKHGHASILDLELSADELDAIQLLADI